jgi:hypothetical protein
MSILYRTKDRLAVGEVTWTWAAELGVPILDLRRLLLGDILAGKLDSKPVWLTASDGSTRRITGCSLRRFKVEHSNSLEVRVVASRPPGPSLGLLTFDRGRELQDLTSSSDIDRYFWQMLSVSRVATVLFARLRELPAPTWWAMPSAEPMPKESGQEERSGRADRAAAEAPLSAAEDPEYPESLLQLEAMIEWVKKSDPGGWRNTVRLRTNWRASPGPYPRRPGARG